jgi:hypothetical protein
MFARPLSVAAVGALALGAAVLFGASGCDEIQDWAHEVIDHEQHPPTGSGGSGGTPTPPVGCASSQSCPSGLVCSTEQGVCDAAPGCQRSGNSDALIACPAVCYGTCVPPKPAGEACGKVTCAAGEVCCNASCGICTPPNGGCVQLFCTDDPPPVPTASCKVDSDCRLTADYCTGCECRAYGANQAPKACTGPTVQCLVDPCMQKTAVCVNGQCTVGAAPLR